MQEEEEKGKTDLMTCGEDSRKNPGDFSQTPESQSHRNKRNEAVVGSEAGLLREEEMSKWLLCCVCNSRQKTERPRIKKETVMIHGRDLLHLCSIDTGYPILLGTTEISIDRNIVIHQKINICCIHRSPFNNE